MDAIEEGAPMEKHIKTPIKEMIGRFPQVGAILEDFGIGCVPCSVGTCLFSDILEIHNLAPGDEEALMTKIAGVVAPGQTVRLPETAKSRPSRPAGLSYSPPMKRLVNEHALIKRFLALVPEIAGRLDLESEGDRELISRGADFIRGYADRYHHAKEEEILFACFDPELDILKAMHEDHRRGRARVKGILDSLERRDGEGVSENLHGYAGILTEHIKKEDEILYPWMDRNLSTRKVGELFAAFTEVDERFREAREGYEAFVEKLEDQFLARSAEVSR
jgi:hemerythrin-like domain-containing protein